jgi:hypothetical protein
MNEDEVVQCEPAEVESKPGHDFAPGHIGPQEELSKEEQAIAIKREKVVELDAKCHSHIEVMIPSTQDEVMIKFGSSYFMLKSRLGANSTYLSGVISALSNLTNIEFREINTCRGYTYPSESVKCFTKRNDDPEITLFNAGNITELKTTTISNQISSDFLDRRIEVGRLDDMIVDKK